MIAWLVALPSHPIAWLIAVLIASATLVLPRELWGWLPILSRAVISLETALLPTQRRKRRREEWSGELLARYDDRRLSGLAWTLALFPICLWERATAPTGHPFLRISLLPFAVAITAALALWPAGRTPPISTLDAVLPEFRDLPSGFTVPLRLPAGAKTIDADELCQYKPKAEGVQDERDAMYTNGPVRTRALFFSIASFKAADASGFLEQLRRLARSCDHWTYKTPGHPPQTSEILDVSEPDGYGDATVRVRMHDPQGDSDFLYVRVGNLVGLVAYEIVGTKTAPAVIEETGRDMAHRMQQAARS